MPDVLANATNALVFVQTPNEEVKGTLICYGTLTKANRYFDNKLRNQPWLYATLDERRAALAEATRIIDRFNFVCDKLSAEQNLEFPRTGQTEVPLTIELACYEVAIKLVDGFDPDIEQDVLAASAQGYGGVRQTYNRDYILEHLRSGIPSATAWDYIKPFLRDPNNITICRV